MINFENVALKMWKMAGNVHLNESLHREYNCGVIKILWNKSEFCLKWNIIIFEHCEK